MQHHQTQALTAGARAHLPEYPAPAATEPLEEAGGTLRLPRRARLPVREGPEETVLGTAEELLTAQAGRLRMGEEEVLPEDADAAA